jgi:hypothetical protein
MAIEAPINVTPNNNTVYVDKTKTGDDYDNPIQMSFTFNGDNLSWWRCEHYDAITGEAIGYSYAPRTNIPWSGQYRNGDTVTINGQVATGLYQNGNDYKYRIILYQADSNNEPLCDMLCVTGRVKAASGTSVTVEAGVTDIDAPYTATDGGTTYTIGQCMLEVVGDNSGTLVRNKIKINAYNKSTGVITLDSAPVGTIAAGTRYKVYRNYYKSPCYFVRCRDKASITPSVTINADTGGVECSALWQIASEKEVSLQKYKWVLSNGAQSKEIYSYHDKGALPERASADITLDTVFPYLASSQIRATVTATTQDGFVQTAQATLASAITRDTNMFTAYTGEINGTYKIIYTQGCAMLLSHNRVGVRVTAASGYENFKLWKKVAGQTHYRYVAACSMSGTTVTGYDNSAEDGLSCEYALSAEKNGNIVYNIVSSITPDYQNRVVIEKLTKITNYFGCARYSIADTFLFEFEVSKPTININDGQAVIKTGDKPIVIKESGRYISGDFSAAITQMSVSGYSYNLNDNTSTYKQALEFFDDNEYLIKIPDRGCIVGKITDKNLKKNEAGATIISFSFTQTKDLDEVIV